jgi:hypothetical protein
VDAGTGGAFRGKVAGEAAIATTCCAAPEDAPTAPLVLATPVAMITMATTRTPVAVAAATTRRWRTRTRRASLFETTPATVDAPR